jgi:predicted AAA+ superfamily ATPase
MEKIIGGIIKEYFEKDYSYLIKRDISIKPIENKSVSIIGVRRSGKSSLLLYYFQKYKEEGKNVIFFSFDDDRIYPPTIKTIQEVIKISKKIYGDEKVYFFFDEIQEVQNWEFPIKRIMEKENHFVFVTGSSSKLLSKEISTQLRGRTISYELFPFSFKEVLRSKNIVLSDYYTESEVEKIKRILEDYIEWGGFPEIVLGNYDKRKILDEYVELILFRDLVERWKIENIKSLKTFVKYAITNFSSLISINKIANLMNSLGRIAKTAAKIEANELRAVLLSFSFVFTI